MSATTTDLEAMLRAGGKVICQTYSHARRQVPALRVDALPAALPRTEGPHDHSPHRDVEVGMTPNGWWALLLTASTVGAYFTGYRIGWIDSQRDIAAKVIPLRPRQNRRDAS